MSSISFFFVCEKIQVLSEHDEPLICVELRA